MNLLSPAKAGAVLAKMVFSAMLLSVAVMLNDSSVIVIVISAVAAVAPSLEAVTVSV